MESVYFSRIRSKGTFNCEVIKNDIQILHLPTHAGRPNKYDFVNRGHQSFPCLSKPATMEHRQIGWYLSSRVEVLLDNPRSDKDTHAVALGLWACTFILLLRSSYCFWKSIWGLSKGIQASDAIHDRWHKVQKTAVFAVASLTQWQCELDLGKLQLQLMQNEWCAGKSSQTKLHALIPFQSHKHSIYMRFSNCV
jgi:hypothetical protein